MSFQRILCPIDFSAGSSYAARVAARIAKRDGAELALVHVLDWSIVASLDGYSVSPQVLEQLQGDAERGLETAKRDALANGAKRVTTKLLTGAPWDRITGFVDADPIIDLIVMGTHGRTGLKRVLLGSVAERVVRHARCPVLAIRERAELAPFRTILCPIDFSASSRHAVDLAAKLVEPGGAGITLLHAIELPVAYSGELPMPDLAEALDKEATRLLAQWAAELKKKVSVPVTTRSRVGNAGAQTLAVLDDESFDLVVTGSHGRTGIKRALLGSVAEKIVRHAPCPVLVARPREEK